MMKEINIVLLFIIVFFIETGCSKKTYPSNGETIYNKGKNLQGQKLLDKNKSQITFIKSCRGCHGRSGERVRGFNIKWSFLSNATKISVAYNDSLFYRFLDEDLKSDGVSARTGVHWNMSTKEKCDLMEYLKTL